MNDDKERKQGGTHRWTKKADINSLHTWRNLLGLVLPLVLLSFETVLYVPFLHHKGSEAWLISILFSMLGIMCYLLWCSGFP